jgi:hypothetical protein
VVPGLPGANRFLVILCHATGSVDSPYLRTTARAASLAELQHDIETGHGTHNGPVFDPNTSAQGGSWGDVIPAFADYPGLNNTGAGADILADGCAVPPTVGVTPVAWNICHWGGEAEPPGYVLTAVTAPTTQDLLTDLGRHAVEVGASGERDVIPITREGSANLACPGVDPAPPVVSVTVTVTAQMCHAEDGVYAKRTEAAVESATGATDATARATALAAAGAKLAAQLAYHLRHDTADVIEPFGAFAGANWGASGRHIFDKRCVVDIRSGNRRLLRPLLGVVVGVLERPGSGTRPTIPTSVDAGRSK